MRSGSRPSAFFFAQNIGFYLQPPKLTLIFVLFDGIVELSVSEKLARWANVGF